MEKTNTMKIVITKRHDDYHACIEGHPEIWGCGRDQDAAVGDLIRAHQEFFNVSEGKINGKYRIFENKMRISNILFIIWFIIVIVLDKFVKSYYNIILLAISGVILFAIHKAEKSRTIEIKEIKNSE